MAKADLEDRVRKLERAISAFSAELHLALEYIHRDAGSSLTKSRVVLEKLLVGIYATEMGHEPRKPLLGDMLTDNQFTRKLDRRILTRMNSIRDMGNLGPHGVAVEPSDAARVLDDLCEVLDWYLLRQAQDNTSTIDAIRTTTAAEASSANAERAGSVPATEAPLDIQPPKATAPAGASFFRNRRSRAILGALVACTALGAVAVLLPRKPASFPPKSFPPANADAASSPDLADKKWLGTPILPKSEQASIKADNGASVSMRDIAWPAMVVRTNGRLLWVQDDGGYSASRAGGWIHADDAVKLADARDYFVSELSDHKTAWLYWMCGICWENSGESAIAIDDYKNALRVEPNTAIDDIEIRLGRLFAAEQLLNGRGLYGNGIPNAWEKHFENAQRINPNRPQLYYEWGFALSQACDCTITRRQQALEEGARTNKAFPDAKTAAPKTDAEQALAEGVASSASAFPKSGPGPADHSNGGSMAEKPPLSRSGSLFSSEAERIALPSRAGPGEAGAIAAIKSLDYYGLAKGLSPNWWRIPLARAELILNQCDEEAPTGERVAISSVDANFFGQLLHHVKQDPAQALSIHVAGASGPTPPSPPPPTYATQPGTALPSPSARSPSDSIASRGEEVPSLGRVKTQAPEGRGLSPAAREVLVVAIDDFDQAISLNPNALDAYRDRAEALRLLNRWDEAEQSALTACKLSEYRQARSVRTLAQICNDTGRFQSAADYALQAAELASGDEQQRFLHLWAMYGWRAGGKTKALVIASEKNGNDASHAAIDGDVESQSVEHSHRIGNDVSHAAIDGDSSESALGPIFHNRIEPPPGFKSRGGSSPQ
jgi:tetratricopeptide (TPR) repeat protein